MLRSNRIALLLLGLLLAGLPAWYGVWFFTHYERYYRYEKVDASPEARRNRLLAAERYLRATGREVEPLSGGNSLDTLPPVQDTLLLGRFSRRLSEQHHQALLEWVERGGLLILEAPDHSPGEPDPLMQQLGVYRETGPSSRQGGLSDGEADLECLPGACGRNLLNFSSGGTGETRISFDAGWYLVDPEGRAEQALGVDGGMHLLEFHIGQGELILLSDLGPFTNQHLGDHDHAFILSSLTGWSGRVWLFHSIEMDSLPRILWRHAPSLVLLSLLLLALILWRLTHFTGPRLTRPLDTRRNLLEHLDAAAGFSWRLDRAAELMHGSRDRIWHRLHRRHPGLIGMTPPQRSEWVAQRLGLETHQIEDALNGEIRSIEDFIRVSMLQQRIITQLKKGDQVYE